MIRFKKKPICKTDKNMLSKVVQNIDDYKCFCDNCPDKNECNIYSVSLLSRQSGLIAL